MTQDPVIVGQTIMPKGDFGANDRVILHQYEGPSDSDGNPAPDPWRAKDAEVVKTMMRWLEKHYPGHLWGCVADLRHGIVKFNIPILMGVRHWWVVNLRTHDIVDGMRQGAGQILERYRLNRGRFNLAQFLDARAQHSKLIVPSRLVPE